MVDFIQILSIILFIVTHSRWPIVSLCHVFLASSDSSNHYVHSKKKPIIQNCWFTLLNRNWLVRMSLRHRDAEWIHVHWCVAPVHQNALLWLDRITFKMAFSSALSTIGLSGTPIVLVFHLVSHTRPPFRLVVLFQSGAVTFWKCVSLFVICEATGRTDRSSGGANWLNKSFHRRGKHTLAAATNAIHG